MESFLNVVLLRFGVGFEVWFFIIWYILIFVFVDGVNWKCLFLMVKEGVKFFDILMICLLGMGILENFVSFEFL